MKTEEKYTVRAHCRNCKWEGPIQITRGYCVETIGVMECPSCGCEELKSLGIYKPEITYNY